MGDIFRLQPREPIMLINNRRNSDGFVGPPAPNTTQKTKEPFSWNTLISSVGDSVTSIFGFLTSQNNQKLASQYPQYPQRNNNLLWIGIGLVAVVVVIIIVATRK